MNLLRLQPQPRTPMLHASPESVRRSVERWRNRQRYIEWRFKKIRRELREDPNAHR